MERIFNPLLGLNKTSESKTPTLYDTEEDKITALEEEQEKSVSVAENNFEDKPITKYSKLKNTYIKAVAIKRKIQNWQSFTPDRII